MRKFGVFALYLGANALLLSRLATAQSATWLISLGGLIALMNLACGIRLGNTAGLAYSQEIVRLNQYLADQNCELIQANRELLERISPSSIHSLPPRREEQRA